MTADLDLVELMAFYSSQGPSLFFLNFPHNWHQADLLPLGCRWLGLLTIKCGAKGWEENSQDGSCTKCIRKRSKGGRWDHPQWSSSSPHSAVHPGFWDKGMLWCLIWWCWLGFETFLLSEGSKAGAAPAPWGHRQGQCHQPQRVPPPGNAATKAGLSSSQSKAEPAWHLGRLWLSEMTFFKSDTFPLLTSTGAQERRGHLLPQGSLAPASKVAQSQPQKHLLTTRATWQSLPATCPPLMNCSLSSHLFLSLFLSAARSARATTLAPKRGD